MPKKLTTKEWVAKARATHGDLYDYSETEYTSAAAKLTYRCKVHGLVTQQGNNHLSGKGCYECSLARRVKGRTTPFSDFVARAEKVHGGRYVYLESGYTTASGGGTITAVCPTHGEFTHLSSNHLQGIGCPSCGNLKKAKSQSLEYSDFVERAGALHSGKYSYSPGGFINSKSKVTISCPDHGDFRQQVGAHLTGRGCPKCKAKFSSSSQRLTNEEFVARCREKHGDRYEIKSGYAGQKGRVLFGCAVHGDFWQRPGAHLVGVGCPKCAGKIRAASKRLSFEKFLDRAKEKQGGKYQITGAYSGLKAPLEITCPDHGSYMQLAENYMNGTGCPKCAEKSRAAKYTMTHKEFVARSFAVHGGRYTILGTYTKIKDKIELLCPDHGKYKQAAASHLTGVRCPKCANQGPSLQEDSIADFITGTLGVEVQRSRRDLLNGSRKELDIYVPSQNVAVEFNGLVWHSSLYRERSYHAGKSKAAEESGIRLIHIYQDQWASADGRRKTEALLKSALTRSCEVIGARKCKTVDIAPAVYAEFCRAHHMAGHAPALVKRGLVVGDRLVAVAGFTPSKGSEGGVSLVRYAVDLGVKVPGGLLKLCSGLPRPIFTYCDKNLFGGESYLRSGFRQDGETGPDLWYTDFRERKNRVGFQKHKLVGRFGEENVDTGMTEKAICEANGWYQIWGAGSRRFVLD